MYQYGCEFTIWKLYDNLYHFFLLTYSHFKNIITPFCENILIMLQKGLLLSYFGHFYPFLYSKIFSFVNFKLGLGKEGLNQYFYCNLTWKLGKCFSKSRVPFEVTYFLAGTSFTSSSNTFMFRFQIISNLL